MKSFLRLKRPIFFLDHDQEMGHYLLKEMRNQNETILFKENGKRKSRQFVKGNGTFLKKKKKTLEILARLTFLMKK